MIDVDAISNYTGSGSNCTGLALLFLTKASRGYRTVYSS